MMNKFNVIDLIIFCIIFLFLIIVINPFQLPKTEESITYFPIDYNTSYKSANTNLALLPRDKLQYPIKWNIHSALSRKTFLRQDIGLLFANGRLVGQLANGKQNTDQISLETKVLTTESKYFQAISYHFSEIHQPDGQILSSQEMSYDELYVIDTKESPLKSFGNYISMEEKEWKLVLDKTTENELQQSWTRAIQKFRIIRQDYIEIPLTKLGRYVSEPLPGYSKLETKSVLGRLWEGLYKDFYLGVKQIDGSAIECLNCTIPLILVSKDKTHLLIVFETSDNTPVLLRQDIAT